PPQSAPLPPVAARAVAQVPTTAPAAGRTVLTPARLGSRWQEAGSAPVPPPPGPPVGAPPAPSPMPTSRPPAPVPEPAAPQRAAKLRPPGHRVALIIVAAVGLGGLVAGSVLAVGAFLNGPQARTAAATTSATASPSLVGSALAPPTDVTYRDGATRITLAWTNPNASPLALIVVSTPRGAAERPYPALPPGTTTFNADVSPRLDYCFSVIAVYGGDRLARSTPVCTHRSSSRSPAN
ncbi:MAG: hypothetical protein J2P15_04015, partial [Micromonosporaceae bacterium]|nr:hypothetical protein [Micromonosporaceae bacterium]